MQVPYQAWKYLFVSTMGAVRYRGIQRAVIPALVKEETALKPNRNTFSLYSTGVSLLLLFHDRYQMEPQTLSLISDRFLTMLLGWTHYTK